MSESQSKYVFGPSRVSWYAAYQYCDNIQAQLLSVHSDDEFQSLKSAINAYSSRPQLSHWIGLYHNRAEPQNPASYLWSDGSTFDFGYDVSGDVYPWNQLRGTNPNSVLRPSCVRLQNNADPQWSWDDVACDGTNNVLAVPICNLTIETQPPSLSPTMSITEINTSSNARDAGLYLTNGDLQLIVAGSVMCLSMFIFCSYSLYLRRIRKLKRKYSCPLSKNIKIVHVSKADSVVESVECAETELTEDKVQKTEDIEISSIHDDKEDSQQSQPANASIPSLHPPPPPVELVEESKHSDTERVQNIEVDDTLQIDGNDEIDELIAGAVPGKSIDHQMEDSLDDIHYDEPDEDEELIENVKATAVLVTAAEEENFCRQKVIDSILTIFCVVALGVLVYIIILFGTRLGK